MKNSLLLLCTSFYAILILSGCTAGLVDPEIDFEPPKYVEQMPGYEDKTDFASTGSIFGQGENPLFSDHKAMHVNDIVTVVISETANSTNVGSKQLNENESTNLGGGVFATAGGNPAMQANLASVNGLTNVGFTTSTINAYQGQGSASKNASFTTTVSARIVKVMQNGNYFIAGKREILVDDQKQVIQISGVIRPYDIDQYNKIDSAQMSDAKILYKTEGEVDRATKRGWGTKIIQAVWPF